jgi:hypothetical protein
VLSSARRRSTNRVRVGPGGHGVLRVETALSAPSRPSRPSFAGTWARAPPGSLTSMSRIPTVGGSGRGWSRRTSASKSPAPAVRNRHW